MDKIGSAFDLKLYLQARQNCIEAVDEIIQRVEPGMTEKQAQMLLKSVFENYGVQKHWHASKFRIGADTQKNFREVPDESQVATAGDICFIDVGPVFFGHEADFGRTFVVGNGASPHRALIEASEDVFKETADYWKKHRTTGVKLFEFATERTKARGFELNAKMPGHRLGDFPHQVYAEKGTLFGLDRAPLPDLWVLEIHALDHKTGRGAFYEDILRAE